MIAFSCVHCGQRMKITEEDGARKATCPKCGHVVTVPAGEGPLLSRLKGKRQPPGPVGDTTVVTANARPPVPPGMDTPSPHQPIHELPTRTDRLGSVPNELTDFLAPAQGPGEIGRLGAYRVLRVLGSGGMGVVFLAEEPQLQRQVALKAMRPTLAVSALARQRFLREARAIAAIQHDHVVTIFAVGEDRGVPFLAMPFLKGESLEARLRREVVLAVAEALRVAREIGLGLAEIHAHGLVHRDIKPGNVWLEGEQRRVKILDFGLARQAAGGGPEEQLTQAGAIVGSPAFMAPEQAGKGNVDARCDLFSLGVVLYQMLTGALPFQGDDALTTLLAVANTEPPPPERHNPQVSAQASALVLRLMSKKPEARPGSAREVVEAVAALERGG